MASSCSKRLKPMKLCPSQHRNTLKEVSPSEPYSTTVRGTNKNNGPRIWVQGSGAQRNVRERGFQGRRRRMGFSTFFFLIFLFLELCVVTITAIPHERGQQRTDDPIAAQTGFHDTKLVQVPMFAVSHMATGRLCSI